MNIDPFSDYNVVKSNREDTTDSKPTKRSPLVAVIVIILLLLLLGLSIFLLKTRTSFFNFASELVTGEVTPVKQTPSPTDSTTINTATVSATNVETTTTSTTIPVPVSTTSPTATPTSVVVENSYMFASPLSAATGNVEKIRITAYILDGTGSGVSGKVITLTGVSALAVTSVQPTTDSMGRAIFDVAAGTSGSYEIGAAIGSSPLSQKVTVTFD